MDLSIEQFEYIEAYLLGQLSEDKRLAFEASLEQNADLKKEMETQRQLLVGLEGIGVQKRLKEAHQRYLASLKETEVPSGNVSTVIKPLTSNKERSISFTNLAVAASVLFVIGFGWFYKTQYYLSSEVIVMAAEQEKLYNSAALVLPKEASAADKQKQVIQKAQWLGALAKIRVKDKKGAKQALTMIAETDGHLFQKNAKMLLEKM